MRHAWLVIALGAISLCACVGGGYAYYAPVAPPPIRAEAFGVAPGPGYVWVNGYWGYRGRGYVWNTGHWERPPRRGSVWVQGSWERRGSRWGYRTGHWR